jgi:hypothetical protein
MIAHLSTLVALYGRSDSDGDLAFTIGFTVEVVTTANDRE